MPRASSRHLEFVTTTYQGAGSFIFFTFWEKSIVLGETCILLSNFHLFCIPSTDHFLDSRQKFSTQIFANMALFFAENLTRFSGFFGTFLVGFFCQKMKLFWPKLFLFLKSDLSQKSQYFSKIGIRTSNATRNLLLYRISVLNAYCKI